MLNQVETALSQWGPTVKTMKWRSICAMAFFLTWQTLAFASSDLMLLKKGEKLADFQVDHLYSDSEGKIIGAKFLHIPTGAPVFLLQIETVPQLFTWVESPSDSNRGLPHALEHLLIAKGSKGRYLNLLEGMRLSDGGAATTRDFVYYGLYSGSGMNGFFEQFHALLDALYDPDFTDLEAEREFYHFSIANDGGTKKTLVESGTVYNEQLSNEHRYDYIYELNKKAFGKQSPFAFDSAGAPDEMRGVTPQEIRRFHDKYYRIGPGTGFIFSFPPLESVPDVLQRISLEFQRFSRPRTDYEQSAIDNPKYPIHPSQDLEPGIYPFPGPNEAVPGFVHFSWAPSKADSLLNLKMLELLFHALASGEDSLLYKAMVDSKTRTFESGATGVDYELSFDNSPWFPSVVLEVSGVPGNRISAQSVDQLRAIILAKMNEVSQYPDQSERLKKFNGAIASYAKSQRRSNSVWIRNPPGFDGYPPNREWKESLSRLEMDPSFVRSLSENREWEVIDQQLKSGKNIWRDVIRNFRLLETPYVTASAPSRKLLEEAEKRARDRVRSKIRDLMDRYHASDEQEALLRFDQEELIKTKKIDDIDAKVPHPRFTDFPPMVPDEGLKYRQFEIEGVPVIGSIFERPPTIDIGLSFDLRMVPQRYYKYLPLLPQCIDSLGLKKDDQIIPYAELTDKIQEHTLSFSTGYESDPTSKRMDFTIRASATNIHEFREALQLIGQVTGFNYLDLSNADRLRDIVARRISTDKLYAKQDQSTSNSGTSFRYQSDLLYVALQSQFTGAHFDNRLRWLLHTYVNREEINRLDKFAADVLSATSRMSRKELDQKFDSLSVNDLERELVEYWRDNLFSFPEPDLADGLRKLTAEVVGDLRTGPEQTIEDLRTLQTIVLNRHALRIDLTLSQQVLGEIQNDLVNFVKSIPVRPAEREPALHSGNDLLVPVMARLEKRYSLSPEHSPLYVGFVNPNRTGGDVEFSADFPSYGQLDRKSLVRVLASGLFSGAGPQSFQARTWTRGLAYHNGIFNDPGTKRIWYYADRSPDIASLIAFVNEMAATALDSSGPSIVDYALSNTFTFSRARSTFSERGKAAAQDIRDGQDPEKIRRFSEEILKLRKEPDLRSELIRARLTAICGVLLRDDCIDQQKSEGSLFFFVGSEEVLSDVEKRLTMPKLLRLYPSDFWLDFSGESGHSGPTVK
jgi:Zn-dependent M16 (insulinase) family peptidase